MAKFGVSVILNVSSIYTNESFPTILRGRATAVCSFISKFGGIIAPLSVEITKNTNLLCGFLCIFAGLILLPLENREANIQFNDEKDIKMDNLIKN